MPATGLRRFLREKLQEIIDEEKKAAFSKSHRRGLPKKLVKEDSQLVLHTRITSYFSLKKTDSTSLPDYASSIITEASLEIPVEPVSIVTEKNVGVA